jgi:hypothetical protein
MVQVLEAVKTKGILPGKAAVQLTAKKVKQGWSTGNV